MKEEVLKGDISFALPSRPTKSAPCSPLKSFFPSFPLPRSVSSTSDYERTINDSFSFHVIHKVPIGDTPYVRAKRVQLVDKNPEKAIPLFWAAINEGDRVDSALKDMAIVMKQQNRAEEAIEAIKSLRAICSDSAQESLDNILLDLYKRCGRLDEQIALLKHKLFLIHQGRAFNGKKTKTARSQGKKFQVSVEQETTRLLGNLGWALMQQNNYSEAETAYRTALATSADNNKMCNLGICLMKQGKIPEAKATLQQVKPAVADGPRGVDSHLKAYERAQEMLRDLESVNFLDRCVTSSTLWQPQPCPYFTYDNNNTDDFPPLPPLPSYNNHNTINSSSISVKRDFPPLDPKPRKQLRFPDENMNSMNVLSDKFPFPPLKLKGTLTRKRDSLSVTNNCYNSLNIDAKPFYSSKAVVGGGDDDSSSPKRKRSDFLMRDLGLGDDDDREEEILWPDSREFEKAYLAAAAFSY